MSITVALSIVAALIFVLISVTAWACAVVAGDADCEIDEHEQAFYPPDERDS